MSFDDNNYDDLGGDAQLPEEANNNRTFMIAVAILAGIILISVACLVGVYLFGRGGNSTQNADATANAANVTSTAAAFIQQALTATSNASILASTTPTATSTPVVNVATATNTPDPATAAAGGAGTPAAATATVGAALTQAAIAQQTIVVTTTALPNTGFADDVGIPGLVVMALVFMIVILLARRLRVAPAINR